MKNDYVYRTVIIVESNFNPEDMDFHELALEADGGLATLVTRDTALVMIDQPAARETKS